MLFKSKILLTLLFLLFCLSQSKAQIQVLSKNALDKIKEGNTYVVVNDLNFPRSVEFYRVLKKYWTVTKGIEFLKASDLKTNLKAGDSYFTMETLYMNLGSMGSAIFYYLSLWTPTEKSLREDRKFDIKDQNEIAQIQFSVHGDVGKRPGFLVLNFDGGGHICNWNPGTLKNYLQQLVSVLQTGKNFLSDDIINKEQLKLLKDQSLYIPDDDLCTTTFTFKTDKYEGSKLDDLFGAYKSDYKIITASELEDKILADTKPFFYLIYINDVSTGKMIAIVNSHTGELIYSKTERSFSPNLRSGDLKDIYRLVNKD